MFLSISIPIYNASRYIDFCLASIMQQSEQDFELVLVDDGSTDNSMEICQKWVEKYPEKIRLIGKENSGSLLTRRICIYESKGDFLYIMDADDALTDRDVLKKIKKIIQSSRCDLLFFECTTDFHNHKPYFRFPFVNGEVFEGENLQKLYRYYITENGLKPLWNKVFSKELVDWNTNYDDCRDVTNGTDYFQSTPIISNAKKVVYCNEPLYFYRVNNNSKSIVHTFKPTIFYAAKENYKRLETVSNNWNFSTEERKSMLDKAYLKMISTSVYKVRLIKKDSVDERLTYIESIGSDLHFREVYKSGTVDGLGRKIILWLLYLRQYKLINMVLAIMR